jgi:small-conductance mechanosensitive channel
VRREDYWEVYWDLTREIKLRLGQENIALAVPHRQARIERG